MSFKDFFLGALAGVLTGVLLSPRSGRETREGLKEHYSEIKDQIIGKAASIRGITKETYENIVDSVVEGYESAKKITSSEASDIRAELKSGYHRIKAVLSQGGPA